MSITKAVKNLASDPFDAYTNFHCAIEYEKLGQIFSAITFYLRAAEYGKDSEGTLVYNSLLKVAECLDPQQERNHSVSNCLLQAIQFKSERPEAYYLLARQYERLGQWQESYTFASVGLEWAWDESHEILEADVGYVGKYALEFQKAVAAYWVGRKSESVQLLRKLEQLSIAPEFETAVKSNLGRINA